MRIVRPPDELSGTAMRRVLTVFGVGVAVYAVIFYRWPLHSAATEATNVLRRGHVLVSLFLGDEMVANWIEGCSWNSLTERAAILLVAGAIFAAATSAGWLALQVLRVDGRLTPLERFALAGGMGLQLVSLLTLSLGLAGAMRPEILIGSGLAAVGGATVLWWRQRPSLAPPVAVQPRVGTGPAMSLHWLWLGVPFVAEIVLGAMLPPLEFDVREYHLQAPKEFYQAGRITFLSHNAYANMPLGSEMLSLAGMIVCGDWQRGALVGKTLIALFGPLGAMVLFAAGRRLVGSAAGIVAALAYVSIPWIALVSMQGLIEGAVAYYLAAALLAAIVWNQSDCEGNASHGVVALAGLLAGGAVSCKYPSVVFVAIPLALWVTLQALSRSEDSTGRGALWRRVVPPLVFLLAVGASSGPWFAKNTVLTGNPVYPLLYDRFDGLTRTAAKDDQWTRAHSPSNFELSDLAARAAGIALTSDWLSPLLLPLAALSLIRWRAVPAVRWLWLYFAYVFITWWMFTHRIDRFWVPALPIAALLAGIGATWSSARGWRVTLATVLALGLMANFVMVTSGVLGDNRYLADFDALRRDPRRTDLWHVYLNDHAGDVKTVLLVGDAQPFDLEVPVVYNTVFDDCIFEQLVRGKTPQQVRKAFDDRGISHVYVSWSEVNRYRSAGNYGFTDFVTPAVFDELVKAGVLEALPPLADSSGQLFRVMAAP